jgi:hypothetical protein
MNTFYGLVFIRQNLCRFRIIGQNLLGLALLRKEPFIDQHVLEELLKVHVCWTKPFEVSQLTDRTKKSSAKLLFPRIYVFSFFSHTPSSISHISKGNTVLVFPFYSSSFLSTSLRPVLNYYIYIYIYTRHHGQFIIT